MIDVKIQIPYGARYILECLMEYGYEAYVVGGCVRDALLGKIPHDWDITTSATPDEIRDVFKHNTIYNTGARHSTLTIVSDDAVSYEVTTFRVDGPYSDNRHPDNVSFSDDMEEDMLRRDFTINALAYNDETGLCDVSGYGIRDLKNRVIRCVGNPDDRFHEDALRIMRALRFAAAYGFSIEQDTEDSIHKNAALLNNIASERIRDELCKMLYGKGILQVLLDYSDVVAAIIPELKPCIGFDQHNRYHQYTVYDHIAHAVANYTGDDLSVKVALLLHDIGKPLCYTEDQNGGHFHGHGVPSHDLAEIVLERLRFDNATKRNVLELVLYHDATIEPTRKVVRRWLNKIGEEQFYRLLLVRRADIRAHAEGTQESRIVRLNALYDICEELLTENACFTMKDMNINGHDIMSIGIPQGKRVGAILNQLLDMVISDQLVNDHNTLLNAAKEMYFGGDFNDDR